MIFLQIIFLSAVHMDDFHIFIISMGLLLSCSHLHGENNSLQSVFYTDRCFLENGILDIMVS